MSRRPDILTRARTLADCWQILHLPRTPADLIHLGIAAGIRATLEDYRDRGLLPPQAR